MPPKVTPATGEATAVAPAKAAGPPVAGGRPPGPFARLPEWAIAYAPVLAAVLYMLPRLWNAQFGLLDDAVTLNLAQWTLRSPAFALRAFADQGRFLPFFCFYYAFLYTVCGKSALLYYLANTAALAFTVGALIAIMRWFAASLFEIWTAALLFLLSSSVSECYYTLSKGEPVMLMCLLASLLTIHRASRGGRLPLYLALAALWIACAAATRETALATVGAIGVWWLLSSWRGFGKLVFLPRRMLGAYLAAAAAAAGLVWSCRLLLHQPIVPGSYASAYHLSAERIAQNAVVLSYLAVRDFPVLCLLLPAAAVLAWRRRLPSAQLPLMMLAWLACSTAILLPWTGLRPYYLLVFAAAASVFCACVAGRLAALARAGGRSAAVALVAAALLLGVLAINNWTFGRYQIRVDDANAGLVDWLRRAPRDSVVLLNVPANHEYVFEAQLFLNEHLDRKDIRFEPFAFSPVGPREAGRPHFLVSAMLRNQLWPLVRGVMLESGVIGWNAALQGLGQAPSTVVQIGGGWRLADIGLQDAWCAVGDRLAPRQTANWCHSAGRPTLDFRQAFYGWSVYRYPNVAKGPVRAASFADGRWTVERASGEPASFPFGETGDLPVPANWEGDGLLQLAVYRPSTNRWMVGPAADGRPATVFSLAGMQAGDVPVAGDWTGRHKASPGFFRPSDGGWRLFRSADDAEPIVPPFRLGNARSIPLAGDWDGGGRDLPGIYNPATGRVVLMQSLRQDGPRVQLTLPAAGSPAVVNWTGIGVDTVNLAGPGPWWLQFANCQYGLPNAPAEFSPKLPPGRMFAGRWKDR